MKKKLSFRAGIRILPSASGRYWQRKDTERQLTDTSDTGTICEPFLTFYRRPTDGDTNHEEAGSAEIRNVNFIILDKCLDTKNVE